MHLFIARYKQIGEKQTHILITEKKYVYCWRPGLSSSFDLCNIYFLALNFSSMYIRVSSGSKVFRKNCAKMRIFAYSADFFIKLIPCKLTD